MTETKTCRACKASFEITDQDAGFCAQMKVALPELCAICGIQQVMTWRNEHALYKGSCAKCKKNTLSMYAPNSPYIVWCHECWWAEDWDAGAHAQAYDPNRPLLEQFYELRKRVPREALANINTTACEFANHVRHSKDCYMVNLATYSETLLYGEWIVKGKDCMDCKKINEGELLIECVDATNCSRSAYLQDCLDSSECFFSYDLKGCTNCLFSSGLRNKSYQVENRQVSKEEYEAAKKAALDGSYRTLQENIKKYEKVRANALHKYSQIINSHDCTGGYIEDSNRLTFCFDAMESQDVKSSASIGSAKSGMYSYSIGWPAAEFFFGSSVMRGGNNIKFSFLSSSSNNCAYVDSVVSCSEAIACTGLKHKEFSILNTTYPKEEYFKIKAELEAKGELSRMPGPEFSTFAYNETAAQVQYPLTREQALSQGFTWQDDIPMTTGKGTIESEKVPDNIRDVSDDFLKQIYTCNKCSRNFRVVQRELEFYRQFGLPLPRECPQCRQLRRREQRTPYKLYNDSCKKCGTSFMTPYPPKGEAGAPDSPYILYCEPCYQREVI